MQNPIISTNCKLWTATFAAFEEDVVAEEDVSGEPWKLDYEESVGVVLIGALDLFMDIGDYQVCTDTLKLGEAELNMKPWYGAYDAEGLCWSWAQRGWV